MTHNLESRSPLSRLRKVVEGGDELEERGKSRLSDALVVVVEELDEDLDRSLNVRQERLASSSKDVSDRVRSDLLLNRDTRVDTTEELLELVSVVVDVKVLAILIIVVGGLGSVGAERLDGRGDVLGELSLVCEAKDLLLQEGTILGQSERGSVERRYKLKERRNPGTFHESK